MSQGWAWMAKKLFSVCLKSNAEIPMGLIKIKKRYFPDIYSFDVENVPTITLLYERLKRTI